MCLIIANLDGRPIPQDYIITAAKSNKNGFGMMYADTSGVLKTIQGLFNIEQILKCFELAEKQKVRYVAHFRMATRGSISIENTHPFIASKHYSGGIGVVHNGTFTLNGNCYNSDRSDTAMFVELLGDEILKDENYHVSLFTQENSLLKRDFGNTIGSWNKLVFLNGLGEINIVNEDAGYWIDGVWYSNQYSIGRGYGTSSKDGVRIGNFLHDKEKLTEILGTTKEELEELESINFDAFSKAATIEEDDETIAECDIEEFEDDEEQWDKLVSKFRNGQKDKPVVKRVEIEGFEIEISEDEIEEFSTTDEIKEQIRQAFLAAKEIDEDDEVDSLEALKKHLDEEESQKSKSTALVPTTKTSSYVSRSHGSSYFHGGYSGYWGSYHDENYKFVEMLLRP